MTALFASPPGTLWPTPEQALILAASVGPEPAAADAFRAWSRGVDLNADFSREIFRLLPLVYDRMRRLGVDDPLMGRLKGVYRFAWYRTHAMLNRVAPVVAALRADGIDMLMLKGVPLLFTYYRNHAVRPMADIDVLVPVDQARRAMATLARLGWHRIETASDDDLQFRHAMLWRNAHGDEIDLHWHGLFETRDAAADRDFWSGSRPFDFAGIATRQLDPALMVAHLVVHGMRHNPEPPIRWIADTMTVLREETNQLDWPRLLAFARRHRLTYRLSLGLDYLATAFSAPVPAEILTQLRASRVSLTERIENTVVLRDQARLYDNALTKQWVIFADYLRCQQARGPFDFLVGLSHYLRYRWRLRGRREIPAIVLRGSLRRLARWRR